MHPTVTGEPMPQPANYSMSRKHTPSYSSLVKQVRIGMAESLVCSPCPYVPLQRREMFNDEGAVLSPVNKYSNAVRFGQILLSNIVISPHSGKTHTTGSWLASKFTAPEPTAS